jgi:copper(I)-binding protein
MNSNNAKVGAGYFKIINNSANKIALNSIQSDISE